MPSVADIEAAMLSRTRVRVTRTSPVASDVQVQGRPVTYIPDEPSELLTEAQAVSRFITLDEYSLGRMVASEGYAGDKSDRRAVATAYLLQASVVATRARVTNQSTTMLLTRSKYGSPLSGRYGEQVGRYASTARDPYTEHVLAAHLALADSSLARGAVQFFSPKVMDRGLQSGRTLRNAAWQLYAWHGLLDEYPERYAVAPEERDRFRADLVRYRGSDSCYVGPVSSVDTYALMALGSERDENARRSALAQAIQVVEHGRNGRQVFPPDAPVAVALLLGAIAALKGIG